MFLGLVSGSRFGPFFLGLVLLFLCLVPGVLVVVPKSDPRVLGLVPGYLGLVLVFLVPKFGSWFSKFGLRGPRFGPWILGLIPESKLKKGIFFLIFSLVFFI